MVEPYVDSLSIIGNNLDLLNEINSNSNLRKKFSKQSLVDYNKERINNIIYDLDNNKTNEKTSKNFKEKPFTIFNNIFTDLHRLFGADRVKNTGLESAQINNEAALDTFNKYVEDDKTIISELFYGKKKEEKFCKICKITQYNYMYQRAIDLNMEKYGSDINLEDEIIELISKEKNKEFCPMCSQIRNLEITKTTIELPKIMVIVFRNNQSNIRINYDKYILDDNYELIGAETTYTPKTNVFGLFFRCFKPLPTKYKLYSNSTIDEKRSELIREQPYVLYYKKNEKKSKKKKKRGNTIKNNEKILSSNESINNKNDITINKKEKKSFIKNNINDEGSVNKYKNKSQTNSKKNMITLYFNFNNMKELFLDTNDSEIFDNILDELYNKYGIKIKNIIFNEQKINLKKTPKSYGIKDKAKIKVLDEMDF